MDTTLTHAQRLEAYRLMDQDDEAAQVERVRLHLSARLASDDLERAIIAAEATYATTRHSDTALKAGFQAVANG